MGAPSKRAKQDRSAAEFDVVRLASALRAPRQSAGSQIWPDIETIKGARDLQMLGRFERPARLAEAMRTDDALFTAYQNRIAPARGLPVRLVAPPKGGARAARILDEAEGLFGADGVGVTADTVADINGCLANHGVAFATNVMTPRDDGSRIDIEVRYFPIEFVRWDAVRRCFMARVEPESGSEADRAPPGITGASIAYAVSYNEVPIQHGDGRWIVFRKHEHEPWKQDAAILPGAIVWAVHAHAVRDLARASATHGNAKVIGEMPEGIAPGGAQGAAYMELLELIASADSPYGIKPFGSKLDYITNSSGAWQVFKEQIEGREGAAARIYLGQDGLLGSNSNAPGIDLRGMFGVRNDIVEGDLAAITRGLFTGSIQIWCAINFADSKLAPRRIYLFPDADEETRRDGVAKRMAAFNATVRDYKANGIVVDQPTLTMLCTEFAVPLVMLPAESAKAPSITLAPTDVAKVVRVNEARASAGLGPLTLVTGAPDPDGFLTVEEFSAKKAAAASAPPAAAPPKPTPTAVARRSA